MRSTPSPPYLHGSTSRNFVSTHKQPDKHRSPATLPARAPSALSFPRRPAREPRLRTARRPESSFHDPAGEPAEDLDDDDGFFGGDGGPMTEDESDGEEDAESSADLFLRFLQSMFRKVARRAKKGSRSVLPDAIPPQLVNSLSQSALAFGAYTGSAGGETENCSCPV